MLDKHMFIPAIIMNVTNNMSNKFIEKFKSVFKDIDIKDIKFALNEEVKSVRGFYRGKVGIVRETLKIPFIERKYLVDSGGSTLDYRWYKESELEHA